VPAQDYEKGPFQEEAAPALSGVGTPLFCEFLAFIAVVEKIRQARRRDSGSHRGDSRI
jgi:hypothetical protein